MGFTVPWWRYLLKGKTAIHVWLLCYFGGFLPGVRVLWLNGWARLQIRSACGILYISAGFQRVSSLPNGRGWLATVFRDMAPLQFQLPLGYQFLWLV